MTMDLHICFFLVFCAQASTHKDCIGRVQLIHLLPISGGRQILGSFATIFPVLKLNI